MRISELETDTALDVICDIMPYVKAISTDDELQQSLKELAKLSEDLKAKTKTTAQIVNCCLEALCDFVPLIFKKHRDVIYYILSRVNEMPIEELKKLSLAETLKLAKELIKDEAFTSLFT